MGPWEKGRVPECFKLCDCYAPEALKLGDWVGMLVVILIIIRCFSLLMENVRGPICRIIPAREGRQKGLFEFRFTGATYFPPKQDKVIRLQLNQDLPGYLSCPHSPR